MTPKEKAIELYNKYARFWHDTNETCKSQCLIAVDEIIKEIESIEIYYDLDKKNGTAPSQTIIPYWHQVKEEITKL
jgi:hypothetical protein